MCPEGPVTSSSRRFARPPQTLRTTDVPSYSTQVFEPLRGWVSLDTWVFQVPISKSKSCAPSRGAGAAGPPLDWACESVVANSTRLARITCCMPKCAVERERSVRLGHSRVVIEPVGLPGLAIVIRKRLLRSCRGGRERLDAEADPDGSAIKGFLVVELTAPLLETPDHGDTLGIARYVQYADAAGGEVKMPLVRGGVIEAQRNKRQVALGSVRFQLRKVPLAAPHGADDGHPIHLNPLLRACQGMQKAGGMGLPGADVEIEPVLRILRCGRRSGVRVQSGHREYECRRKRCGRESPPCVVCESSVHGDSLVRSAIKAGAQVAPPSAEYDSV